MSKQATKPALAAEVQTNSIEAIPAHEQIAALAHSLWQARGCPEGTPDEDWFNAERALSAKSAA